MLAKDFRKLVGNNFFADMGPRPEGMTLDRIDVNKGYKPSKCRWATSKEQANNRRPRKLDDDSMNEEEVF